MKKIDKIFATMHIVAAFLNFFFLLNATFSNDIVDVYWWFFWLIFNLVIVAGYIYYGKKDDGKKSGEIKYNTKERMRKSWN
jgi:hypothetical protein